MIGILFCFSSHSWREINWKSINGHTFQWIIVGSTIQLLSKNPSIIKILTEFMNEWQKPDDDEGSSNILTETRNSL